MALRGWVFTWMGDHVWVGKPSQYVTESPVLSQPSIAQWVNRVPGLKDETLIKLNYTKTATCKLANSALVF